ncbi:MAG: hypothetical protein ACFFD1_02160 [Candidatus Thorarchaeota archaeon]
MPSKASYWVASHITGLFEILNRKGSPLNQGSRGAGFSINRGVITTVKINENTDQLKIFFDNKEIKPKYALISSKIINLLVPPKKKNMIEIYHEFEIPIGAGFGASAAGALGLAFCLNKTMNLGYSALKLWQTAHIAEIECKSGLGDVIGLYQGETEIRYEPGAPGIGKTENFLLPNKNENIITINFGKISTAEILSSKNKRICARGEIRTHGV